MKRGALIGWLLVLLCGWAETLVAEDYPLCPPLRDPFTYEDYPWRAARDGVQGRMEVALFLEPDGSASAVKVLRAEPAGAFEKVVLDAARAWRFETPAPEVCRFEIVFGLIGDLDPRPMAFSGETWLRGVLDESPARFGAMYEQARAACGTVQLPAATELVQWSVLSQRIASDPEVVLEGLNRAVGCVLHDPVHLHQRPLIDMAIVLWARGIAGNAWEASALQEVFVEPSSERAGVMARQVLLRRYDHLIQRLKPRIPTPFGLLSEQVMQHLASAQQAYESGDVERAKAFAERCWKRGRDAYTKAMCRMARVQFMLGAGERTEALQDAAAIAAQDGLDWLPRRRALQTMMEDAAQRGDAAEWQRWFAVMASAVELPEGLERLSLLAAKGSKSVPGDGV